MVVAFSEKARKMKICYIIHVFPPESWGGSENYVYMLAQQFRQQHEVRILTRTHRPDYDEYALIPEVVDGLPVFRINNNFRDVDQFERVYRNPKVDAVAMEFLREWRPDVIHAHHLTCLSTGLVEVARCLSIPFLFTIHDFWMMCLRGQRLQPNLQLCEEVDPRVCGQCVKPWIDGAEANRMAHRVNSNDLEPGGRSTLRQKMRGLWMKTTPTYEIEAFHKHSRAVLKNVDALIMTSAFVRDEFVKFGCDPKRMILSDNGIDTSLVAPVPPPGSKELRFGFVATLIPSKGAHVLVEAFRRLAPGSARLSIYGEPAEYEGHSDYFQKLQQAAAGYAIEFHGKFPIKEIGNILAAMDVLVVPSIWFENAPLIIRQAHAAGIPVITGDRGGMAESVLNEIDGLHFLMDNVDSLAQSMRRLVDDPALLRRLRSSKARVKTIEENAEELKGIYIRFCRK